ncbi:MAG: TonB-dependent receptor [Bacteroidales bacterium]|nr:TonB-dependent receptor [Bacteroidales bacterium]
MWTAVVLAIATIIQPADTATDRSLQLDEVVVVSGSIQGVKRSVKGQVASIEEHLLELNHTDVVRRGSYAWEPVVNNMQSERVSTTIDGMKIFYACTDKMDPVTSYVESGNLQSISLNSGLNGNPQSTGNIGGSLDLKLRKVGFDNDAFRLNVSAGHEWNGHLQVYGADVALSSHRFYTNFGAFYRHAGNYEAGGGQTVQFSKFGKVNAFTNLGYRLAENHILEGTFIYDRATDVGYPALNMDVYKAEGIISSLSYRWQFSHPFLNSWETKVYYNHITHVMDDTTRPDVEIHMDMPGKSWTTGLYSILRASNGHHNASVNYDIYYNRLFADMTMYPGGAAPMYMVTWPDVGTLNTGLALADQISLAHHQSVGLSAKLAIQSQQLNNYEGYQALKVFFSGMTDAYHQVIGRVAAHYAWSPENWKLTIGTGWGSRAPTVTEAYGYYLNNTFDQYDYIGNPRLKNESAIEVNGGIQWHPLPLLNLQWDANAFFFSNYIIGEFETRLSSMTVGAEGVKVYYNQDHAKIINTSLSADWQPLEWLKWTGQISYALGHDAQGDNLPLISPWAFQSRLDFLFNRFSAQISVKGNARQAHFGHKYGEKETSGYTILNLSAQYNISVQKTLLTLRAGVENLLDKTYSTYSDWNNIPQKGRNVYVNLSVSL